MALHIFKFDEQYTTLQGYGSKVELKVWYDAQTALSFMVFRGGNNEELAIVDEGGHCRIYSFTTQQFRWVVTPCET